MNINKEVITSQDLDKYNLTSKKELEDASDEQKNAQKALLQRYRNGSNIIIPLWLESKGKCTYCGTKLSLDNYTIDHIIPLSKGGITTYANLCVSCEWCNKLKGSLLPEDFREQLKDYSKTLQRKLNNTNK